MEGNIMVAVVAGLFSLLGGFLGAWVARQTEYKKWLRQERSTAFAEFLKEVHSVREKILDVIHDYNISEKDRDIKVTQLFVGLNGQENVVRLYLSKKDRSRFSELKKDLSILLSPMTGQVKRIKNVERVMSEIQSIFEKTIHY